MNFLATIHRLRAPGMAWKRLPLFTWAIYATSWVQLLATPVLAITLLLIIMERFFGVGFFDPAKGGDPILFEHMFWIYSHPAVYIMIIPAMGVVSDIIPVFSRRNIYGYTAIAASSLAIAFVGYLVWGHHMFTSGMSDTARIIFSFLTFLVAVPSGVKVFNWIATFYKGSISMDAPLLYALGFIFLFSIGGLTGLIQGALATNLHVHGTYFIVAHFHYVMFGGAAFGFFAGLHYWYPEDVRQNVQRTARKARLGLPVHRLQHALLLHVRARLAGHAAAVLRLPPAFQHAEPGLDHRLLGPCHRPVHHVLQPDPFALHGQARQRTIPGRRPRWNGRQPRRRRRRISRTIPEVTKGPYQSSDKKI